MTTVRETNFKFSFSIEINKQNQRWIWKIFDHKKKLVAQSSKSLESREECKNELSRLANSIKEYLNPNTN
jgi:hypothetical protein